MELCDWPQKHMESLAHFYFNIELKPMQSQPNNERVLITYQAKVRWQWHDDLTRGQGFNITPMNQKLLSTMAEEVWDVVKLDAIRKVSNPSLPSFSRDTHWQSPPPHPSSNPLDQHLPCHHHMPYHNALAIPCQHRHTMPLPSLMPFTYAIPMPHQPCHCHMPLMPTMHSLACFPL